MKFTINELDRILSVGRMINTEVFGAPFHEMFKPMEIEFLQQGDMEDTVVYSQRPLGLGIKHVVYHPCKEGPVEEAIRVPAEMFKRGIYPCDIFDYVIKEAI